MIRQYACLVDSLTQGTASDSPGYSIAQAGSGCWAELVAERLGNLPAIGPLLSSGLRGVWIRLTNTEWQETAGTWTAVVGSDTFDKAPSSYRANGGTGFVQTYRVPAAYRPNVGIKVYWVDYGAGGNWQYNKDGSGWVNMAQTLAHDDGLKCFYISGAVNSTFAVRAYSGSGNVGCLVVGIELFYSDPTTATQGLIMHNLGVNGQSLNTRMNASAGDKNAFLDSVTLAPGTPIPHTINAGVLQLGINDTNQVNDVTVWDTDLRALYARTNALGPVAFINPNESLYLVRTALQQTNYRNQTKTTAAALGVPVFDLFDSYTARGYADSAASLAAGLFISASDAHPSQLGHLLHAEWLYWFIRNTILSVSGNPPSRYVATAKASTKAYTGKVASRAYSAGTPIAIGT